MPVQWLVLVVVMVNLISSLRAKCSHSTWYSQGKLKVCPLLPESSSMFLTMFVLICSVLISSLHCIVSAQSDNCGTSVKTLIINGRPISKGEYPWLVALYQPDGNGEWQQVCGGALLSSRFVITAAHCLYINDEIISPKDIKVGIGKLSRNFYDNEDSAIIANVIQIIIHEGYYGSLSSYALDVGLLRLDINVEMSDYILPVCIDLHTKTTVNTGARVHVAGWGTTENGTSTDQALAADLSYLDTRACLRQITLAYRKYVTYEKFCSLSINSSQVDKGDSGGALTYLKNNRHFIIGVVSTKIMDKTAFSIFTDLSKTHINSWIKETMSSLTLPEEQMLNYTLKAKKLPQSDICGLPGSNFNGKIIIGRAAELGTYPWMANLGYMNRPNENLQWLCTGSLITNHYVLTAAHCIDPKVIQARRHWTLTTVRLGELDLDPFVEDGATPIDFEVEKIIVHEEHDKDKKINNVGLVRTKQEVIFTAFIRPICLPSPEFQMNDFVGFFPTVAGWGNTINANSRARTPLLESEVEIKDTSECRANITSILSQAVIDKRVICASTPLLDPDSCEYKSGGPLMLYRKINSTATKLNMFQMGIDSYGFSCALEGYPSVYTKVVEYLPWIMEKMDL